MGNAKQSFNIKEDSTADLDGDTASSAPSPKIVLSTNQSRFEFLRSTFLKSPSTPPQKPLIAAKPSLGAIPKSPLKCPATPQSTPNPFLGRTKTFLYPAVNEYLEKPVTSLLAGTAAALEQEGSSPVYEEVADKLVPDESKGVLIERRHDIFFNLKPHEECQQAFRLPIPEGDLQGDSLKAYVTCGADILQAVVENLEKCLRKPEGCGVRNLTILAENSLVLDYLKTINCLSPETRERAVRNLRSGYERQLTFKRADGSFSPRGEQDEHGSTWLTAYVLSVFLQVSDYIGFDRLIRDEAIGFLQSKQEKNGSYREDSCSFEMTNINDVGLTAYVILVMLEADSEKCGRHIGKALTYIRKNRMACESDQSTAIAAYVLNMVSCKERRGGKSPFLSWLCEPIDSQVETSLDDLLKFARKVVKYGAGEYEVVLWDTESSKRLGSLSVHHGITQEIGQIELPKGTREIAYEVKGYGRGWFRICYSYKILPQLDRPCFQLIN